MDLEWIKQNAAIVVSIIAAISSLVTAIVVALFKYISDRFFQSYKLKLEYKYDQQKKIKEQLSKNKMQFLNISETLYHRLKNLSENSDEQWLDVEGDYTEKRNTYFISTVYRMAVFFAWIKKIEKDMIFLDVTLAEKQDLYYIKYLKLMQLVFCDHTIFSELDYDHNYATDHFYRNSFEKMVETMIINGEVCEFGYYENDLKYFSKEMRPLFRFIDGINPDEDRYRWDILQLFLFTLIGFLNSYGYDFQYTNKKEVRRLLNVNRLNPLAKNYINTVKKMKVNKNKELKKIMKELKKHNDLMDRESIELSINN